jgi:hypothetical protein
VNDERPGTHGKGAGPIAVLELQAGGRNLGSGLRQTGHAGDAGAERIELLLSDLIGRDRESVDAHGQIIHGSAQFSQLSGEVIGTGHEFIQSVVDFTELICDQVKAQGTPEPSA